VPRPDALCLVGLVAFIAVTDAPRQVTSGLDRSSFDASIRPQDDLYRYVNGGWLARTDIPPDRVSYGAFTELTEKAETDLRAVIEELPTREHYLSDQAQFIALRERVSIW
jgi:predicted metalloendopeptidase